MSKTALDHNGYDLRWRSRCLCERIPELLLVGPVVEHRRPLAGVDVLLRAPPRHRDADDRAAPQEQQECENADQQASTHATIVSLRRIEKRATTLPPIPFPFQCALAVLPAIMLLICGAFTINQLPTTDWTPQKRSEVRRIWIIGGVVSAAYILLLFIARAVLTSR